MTGSAPETDLLPIPIHWRPKTNASNQCNSEPASAFLLNPARSAQPESEVAGKDDSWSAASRVRTLIGEWSGTSQWDDSSPSDKKHPPSLLRRCFRPDRTRR